MSDENLEEAKIWLKAGFTDGLFNRFQNLEEALEFVEKLYSLGASKVSVSIEKEIGSEDFYRSFLVDLPIETDKCQDIYKFCLTEEENADILPMIASEARDNKIQITWYD